MMGNVPPLLRGLLLLLGMVLLVGLIWGQFVPSAITMTMGYAGLVLGTAAAAFLTFRWKPKPPRNPSRHRLFRNPYIRIPLHIIFGGFVGFRLLVHSVPMLLTLLLGSAAAVPATVASWHYGLHTCAGPNLVGISPWATDLCMTDQVKPGTKLLLRGRQTALGLLVSDIVISDPSF